MAIGGLALTRQQNLKHNIDAPQALDHEIYKTLTVDDSTIYEIDSGVTITYNIIDYDGENIILSGRNVSAQASCTMFHLNDTRHFWEDHGSNDQTFIGILSKSRSWAQIECVMKLTLISGADWKNESNVETIAEVLRALYDETLWNVGSELPFWAAPLANKSNKFSVTCKKSITNGLAVVWRANAPFPRCGI